MKTCYIRKLGTFHIAIADLVQQSDDQFLITRINVPHYPQNNYRGLGHGSSLLKEICADADREGITLNLSVFASNPDFNFQSLVSWYSRYGFVKTSYSDMTRKPKEIK